MRFFHCILLISAWPCALSTDSESLMQVDVKTHDEKTAVATGVFNTLKNKLDEAALGSGNHLAVSAMLNLAEQEAAAAAIPTAADSTALVTILTQVAALIHEILWDDLITVKTAEYNEMISYSASSMVSCTDPSTYAAAQALLTTAQTFRTTHNDCRAEEENKYRYYLGAGTDGNCTIAISRATTIMGSVADRTGTHSLCTVPNPCGSADNNPCEHSPTGDEAALPGTIGEWQDWFQNGKDSFGSTQTDSFQNPTTGLPESVQQACVNSKIAYTLQRQQCEQDQTNFENKWCEFRTGLLDMCSTRASCSSGVSSSYSALEPSWIAASALRAKQACVLEHMLCIIVTLKNGDTDVGTACDSNGTDLARCTTIWGNEMTTPSSADGCDENGDTLNPDPFNGVSADPSPGQAGWGASTNSEYTQYNGPAWGTTTIIHAVGVNCVTR